MMKTNADSEIITSKIKQIIDWTDLIFDRKKKINEIKKIEKKKRIRNQNQKKNRDEKKKNVVISIEN